MAIEIHEVRVPAPGTNGQDWEVAATIFLPGALSLASGPDIFFLLAGAGYSRGYFNLPVAGYSQALYHAGRGNIVVTLDYLGSGESSKPEDATFDDAAASTHNAVMYIEKKLVEGTMLPGLGPVRYGALVAAGQSLGGHVLVATQGNHGTFKGIATLGTSTAGTQFPSKDGGKVTDMSQVDFPFAFHWGDIKQVDASTAPTDLETLIGVDVAIGCPMRTGTAPWASNSIPSYTGGALEDGVPQSYAAKIDKTVLLAVGERDVTRSYDEEAATFSSSPDVNGFTLPASDHMHNFTETREQLWKRLDTFVMHASTFTRKIQSTLLMEALQKEQAKNEAKAAEMMAGDKE